MVKLKRLVLWGIVASFASALLADSGPFTRRGTSVLHYSTRGDLVATDVASNAAGSLRLQYNTQGHSTKQSFTLTAAGLDPSTTYALAAVVGSDTNSIFVSTFKTDRNGKARVSYKGNGSSNGNGHGRKSFPDALNPITDLRGISVVNASTQTVAYAWVDAASSAGLLVKRNLTPADPTGTAAGSISLIGDLNSVNFRLLAGGLSASNSYYLSLNSNIMASATADANGRAIINAWPTNAPALLDLQLLQLLDSSSNAVLSTTLPK